MTSAGSPVPFVEEPSPNARSHTTMSPSGSEPVRSKVAFVPLTETLTEPAGAWFGAGPPLVVEAEPDELDLDVELAPVELRDAELELDVASPSPSPSPEQPARAMAETVRRARKAKLRMVWTLAWGMIRATAAGRRARDAWIKISTGVPPACGCLGRLDDDRVRGRAL